MNVGELRSAIAGLPDDMPLACTSTHLTSGMAAAVVRYYFASSLEKRRYCDGLWIGWAGDYYFYETTDDGRIVDRRSGYQPELQTVLHDDGIKSPTWTIAETKR